MINETATRESYREWTVGSIRGEEETDDILLLRRGAHERSQARRFRRASHRARVAGGERAALRGRRRRSGLRGRRGAPRRAGPVARRLCLTARRRSVAAPPLPFLECGHGAAILLRWTPALIVLARRRQPMLLKYGLEKLG